MTISGKTIVITGASAGIGAAAARQLHKLGARVVVVGRDPSKTATVAASVGGESAVADFAKLSEVRRLASELLERFPTIDVFANNAGGTFPKPTKTDDGHTLTFQTNHLAPYLLTRLLKDRLVSSRATIIQTSSAAHAMGHVDFDNLDAFPTIAGGFRAYGTSKLENILFTRELQRRWGSLGIRAASFHPGVVASEFGRDSFLTGLVYKPPFNRFMRTVDGGAETLTWLATTDDWLPGAYYANRKEASTTKAARSSEDAERLWDLSAKLVDLEP